MTAAPQQVSATVSNIRIEVETDTTAPVISNVAAGGITTTSATITWTTNENSDSQVEYGPTTAYGQLTTLNPALVTAHSQGLSGLTRRDTISLSGQVQRRSRQSRSLWGLYLHNGASGYDAADSHIVLSGSGGNQCERQCECDRDFQRGDECGDCERINGGASGSLEHADIGDSKL